MVTSFGRCCVDGRGALQSFNCSRCCKAWEKMRKKEMLGDRDMVMEVEGVWDLGGIGRVFGCRFVY